MSARSRQTYLGTILECIFDCWNCSVDALCVSDGSSLVRRCDAGYDLAGLTGESHLLVLRHVEIDSNQNALL